MDGRVSKVLSSYLHSTNIACRRPWGFVIPLAIYVVISFPPLIGQEIVATFCGMIWGLGEGFGIVAAGTIIGEILLFTYACPFFTTCLHALTHSSCSGVKYFFSAKLQTKEKSSVSYACYARVIREGGWIMCAVFRLSVFPPHCEYPNFFCNRTKMLTPTQSSPSSSRPATSPYGPTSSPSSSASRDNCSQSTSAWSSTMGRRTVCLHSITVT